MSQPLAWCPSCWQDCPGLDPEGFCWDANHREINARLRRHREEDARYLSPVLVIPPPPVPVQPAFPFDPLSLLPVPVTVAAGGQLGIDWEGR